MLLKHPAIEDAAVTGHKLEDNVTEVPRAYVVLSKTYMTLPTAKEIYTFARRQLASYKALDGGVIFTEEIPRTPSGKIQRFRLVQFNQYREAISSLEALSDMKKLVAKGGSTAAAAAAAADHAGGPIQVIGMVEGRVTV